MRGGVAALFETKRTTPANLYTSTRAGWRLPPHRVQLLFVPSPSGAIDDPTPLHMVHEASDETAGIVARLGYLLRQEDLRWRICPCGCGERFIKEGEQQYATPECATRVRQKAGGRRTAKGAIP